VLATLLIPGAGRTQGLDAPRPLSVGVLVDFVDDASGNPHFAASHVESMMERLQAAGVSHVSWAWYADSQGGHKVPRSSSVRTVYERLGNPLAKAVAAGHKQGLKVYGYFKPYEMGVDLVYPEGSPEAAADGLFDRIGGKLAWADPFVPAHPDLCIQHRSVTLSEPVSDDPIAVIKLFKSDDTPTRISKDHLQIWTSSNNYRYERQSLDFQFRQSVEKAEHDVVDINNAVITRAGGRVRVLTLSGLEIAAPYVLVTTDFEAGPADFVNTATRLMRVYDASGAEIKGGYANGFSIYNADRADFRNWGLMFDHGYGLQTGAVDASNRSGKAGLIAFARGRARRLGAPCESEPLVKQYWLEQVEAILATGADGVEFRIENHSTHTDFPEEYGYNQVVLDRLPDPTKPTRAQLAKARGDAYTDFLVAAKKIIAARGKTMRINFELDKLSGDLPNNRRLAYPDNMELQWERWIEMGLPDEAVLRSYGIPFDQILAHPTTNKIMDSLAAKRVPIFCNRYVGQTADIRRDIEIIRKDPRFFGFVFYEAMNFLNYGTDGTTSFRDAEIPAAMRLAAGNRSRGGEQ
jgi:hypothetical protein